MRSDQEFRWMEGKPDSWHLISFFIVHKQWIANNNRSCSYSRSTSSNYFQQWCWWHGEWSSTITWTCSFHSRSGQLSANENVCGLGESETWVNYKPLSKDNQQPPLIAWRRVKKRKGEWVKWGAEDGSQLKEAKVEKVNGARGKVCRCSKQLFKSGAARRTQARPSVSMLWIGNDVMGEWTHLFVLIIKWAHRLHTRRISINYDSTPNLFTKRPLTAMTHFKPMCRITGKWWICKQHVNHRMIWHGPNWKDRWKHGHVKWTMVERSKQ